MILLDTHVVVWLAFEPGRISRKARAAIVKARAEADGLAICDVTLLELATLARKARLRTKVDIEAFLSAVESRFVVLPISARACVRAAALPKSFPKDPADRIIAGTALAHAMPLLTADRDIHRSKALNAIW